MRRASVALLSTVLTTTGSARASEPTAFKPVRSDEDYGYLQTVQSRSGLDPLRYIPLGGSAYLGLGGETRLRVDAVKSPRFGLGDEASDSFALGRLLFSGDLHLSSSIRLYGELGLHRDLGRRGPRAATDRNGLDAQVLFVDIAPTDGWRLRLGRQELQLNPIQRFIAVREAPNIRQSFDGARITHVGARLKLDAFYLQPIALSPGAFDDTRNRAQRFYGLYASATIAPHRTLDVYLLGLERDRVRFGSVAGDERRISLGARLAGTVGPFDYDTEGLVQVGSFSGRRIEAFAASASGGYTLSRPFATRVGLRLDLGSGDRDPKDGRLQTFNPLFPKGGYFNETGLTSWGNLASLRTSLGMAPAKGVNLEASYAVHRRMTNADAIYLQPLAPLASATLGAKHIGEAIQLDGSWQVNRNLKFQGQVAYQATGSTVRALGGRPTTSTVLFAQLRF